MGKSFKLKSDQPLSRACIEKGLLDFKSVMAHIEHLPYGRTKDRSNYASILDEHKGTCSTKHAFLKAVALENGEDSIALCLGIFKMNTENTPKIKSILKLHHLDYIPEAHCYLKINGKIVDITFRNENDFPFSKTLMFEQPILPEQIGAYKIDLHRSFLRSWLKQERLPFGFDKLWSIREACIHRLSE